jgi:predicted kinase
MKELHTQRPLVIGLVGLPGAGKSTFAIGFSSMFGAPTISAGQLQREIFGTTSPTPAQTAGLKRVFWTITAELFKAKHIFILDGHANSYADRSEIRAHAKKAGYDVLFVWVQTSEEIAASRAINPKRGANNLAISQAAFEKAFHSFEAPRASEDHVVLSGQRTFASQVRPILKRIAEGHEAKIQPPQRRNIFIR